MIELEKSKVEIMVPLADVAKQTVKKKTDKVGKDYYNVQPYLYSLPQKNKEGGIYVDSSHLTHGLLFPGVNIFNQSGNGLCIFKHPLHQNIDPKGDLTTEQKNELDPVFKSIMDELDLEKDKNAAVSFEAGKLKDLLLSPVQQRRLTGIVAKHDSEWKKTRAADFSQTCDVYRANGKEEIAKRIEKRIADLSIKLEVDGFNTDKQAYYLHPLGLIGWFAVSQCCCIDIDKFIEEYKSKHSDIGWYDKNRATGRYEKIKLPQLNSQSENNLRRLVKGIIDYYSQSDYEKCNIPRLAYMLATIRVESYNWRKRIFFGILEEDISYEKAEVDYGCGLTARRASVARKNGCRIDGDGYKYRG